MTNFNRTNPVWIWMDVSDTCNLSCRDCYSKQHHQPNLMDTDGFKVFARKIKTAQLSVHTLHLNWRAEPLINKRLTEFLDIRNQIIPDVRVEFHTNGTLVRGATANGILQRTTVRDRVYVSFDGGSSQSHEENRGAKSWARAVNGFNELVSARDKLECECAQVGIYEIVFEESAPYSPEFLHLTRKADVWSRVPLLKSTGEASWGLQSNSKPNGPCFWLGNAICVNTSGDAYACLLPRHPRGIVGNVFTDNLETIIGEIERMRGVVEESGRVNLQHCSGCQKNDGRPDE